MVWRARSIFSRDAKVCHRNAMDLKLPLYILGIVKYILTFVRLWKKPDVVN